MELIKYLISEINYIFYISFIIILICADWLYNHSIFQNIYFILFKLKKIDDKQKEKFLNLCTDDFDIINKYLFKVIDNRVKKDLNK